MEEENNTANYSLNEVTHIRKSQILTLPHSTSAFWLQNSVAFTDPPISVCMLFSLHLHLQYCYYSTFSFFNNQRFVGRNDNV